MAKRRSIRVGRLLAIGLFVAAAGGLVWIQRETQPMPPQGGKPYIRIEKSGDLRAIADDLAARRIIRNPLAFWFMAKFNRAPSRIGVATYKVTAGQSVGEIISALKSPMRQMVRLPETNWAKRSANLLERADVCSAPSYMELFADPKQFKDEVSFPLEGPTLEGYLFPDTYDLPPLMGAREVIKRQLRAFETKVWEPNGKPENLLRVLTVASLVELEVAKDEERPIVAGVIENRIRRKMRLQIDASINYALQKWRPLAVSEYRSVKSPYNTYLADGLPPGPICSPSLASVQAALSPAKHNYLYYVAMPGGYHLFAATYAEHLRNVAKRRAAMRNQP